MEIKKLFDKPKIIAIVGDVNEAKSMLLYNLLEELSSYKFNLVTYGLRVKREDALQVFSVAEIEGVRNSILVIDEFSSLFDLDNRKIKRQIENTLRLINHNNNILILSGVPENYKKFISGKVDIVMFKKVTLADLINGCRIKNILTSYKGYELGTEILNLPKETALVYDGEHYTTFDVKYLKQYDTKKDNEEIVKCAKDVRENVHENVLVRKGFIKVVN